MSLFFIVPEAEVNSALLMLYSPPAMSKLAVVSSQLMVMLSVVIMVPGSTPATAVKFSSVAISSSVMVVTLNSALRPPMMMVAVSVLL